MSEDVVFDEALKLPTGKRTALAAVLLRSLDGDPDEDKLEDWETVRDRTRKQWARQS